MSLCNHSANLMSYIRKVVLISIIISPRILPGITLGYSAIALPQLNITINEASWFSSLTFLGSPFGFIFFGLVIDHLGRKISLLCSIIPSTVGWYLLTSNFDPIRTYTGRFLTAFTTGATGYTVSTYLEESFMRHTFNFRSRFITWSATALAFGICVVYTLGSMFPYDQVALINLWISVIMFILIFIFIPESPMWLYKIGRYGDADAARNYLRIQFFDEDFAQLESLTLTNSLLSRKNIFNILLMRDVHKPLFITTVLLSFSMLSGGLTLSTYMVSAIQTKTFFKSSYQFAIISGVLQFLISASISFILPWSGNRKLTLISGFGLTVGMSVIAFTSQTGYESNFYYIDHIHTLAVWFSISMFSFGFLTLPNALLREIFPPEVQGLACIPIIISFTINCSVIKMHLHLFRYYGGIVYIFYALMDAVGTYFVWILMPETTGRSLKHIQSEYF